MLKVCACVGKLTLLCCVQAETFNGNGNPVIAIKGCRLSDWGGQFCYSVFSLFVLNTVTDISHSREAFEVS